MTLARKPFVPLAFPVTIVWGQRRGASVDRAHRQLLGPGGHHLCGWCAAEVAGRRTAWCSDACADRFYRVWSWGAVSRYIAERDGGLCQRCGGTGDEVDHIQRVIDGGTDDPANLRLLCHDCHVAVGYEQRAAARLPSPQLSLEA